MANIMAAPAEAEATHNSRADADDYEIERELGRGGSGTVYLATDRRIGRKVAVKLLNTLRVDDEISEQRFRTEIEATAALDHPNIIPIHANGEMDGRPFFTMKYVDGGSLSSHGEDFHEPEAAVAVVEKIARAVHHAHERGILHRDLKPSNILLDTNSEPYVSDFGIAKREDDQLNLTMTGTVVGTPNYMSPEQARGDNSQLTTATDVFSLGAIFFELLNHRQAFEGSTSHSVMRNVIESDVNLTRNESQRVHRDLSSISLKALEKDPARRYSSALAMAEDLARWQRGEPVTARHITGGERALRWMRRRPVLVGAITLAILSMIAGTTLSLLSAKRAGIAREAAEENAYFANVGSALSARERANFGEALRHLSNCPDNMQGRFEWRLVNALSRGSQVWSSDFGIGSPLHLDHDPAADELLLLTTDRSIHRVDRHTGETLSKSSLPATDSNDFHQLNAFSCSPDGLHYLFIDAGKLYVVERATASIIHSTGLPPNPSAEWLTKDRILYAHGPFAKGVTPPEETAWIFNLPDRRTEALTPKGWSGPITVSPNGEKVGLVRMYAKVVTFSTATNFHGSPDFRYRGRPPFKEIAFSGDMKNIAILTGTTDSHLEIFDMATEERVFEDYWPAPSKIALISGVYDVIVSDQESWFMRCRGLGVKARLKILQEGSLAASPTLRHDEIRSGHPPRRQADGPIAPPPRSFVSNLTGSRKKFTLAHKAPLVDLRILHGEGDFYTASRDGTLRYWRSSIPPTDPMRLDKYSSKHDSHLPLASHNGRHVAIRGNDGEAARWARFDAGTQRSYDFDVALAVLNDGSTFTRSTDGSRITSRIGTNGDPDALIELWHADANARSGSTFVTSVVATDEKKFVSLFDDHLLIFDIESRTAIEIDATIDSNSDNAGRSISLSPDGRWLAATGYSEHLSRIYDLHNPQRPYQIVTPSIERNSRPSACQFSPDATRLYVASLDGWVHAFDWPSRTEIEAESWRAHNDSISALAISQAGDIIATAGGTSISLWSTELDKNDQRRLRLQLNTGPGTRNWLQFCAEDTVFLHSAADRPIEIFVIPKKVKKATHG